MNTVTLPASHADTLDPEDFRSEVRDYLEAGYAVVILPDPPKVGPEPEPVPPDEVDL